MRTSSITTVTFLAILACFSIDTAFAESTKKTTKTKNKSGEKYDVSAFDLTREKLPAAYNGHDAMKLYTALNNRKNIAKGEFESTKEFEKRLANEHTKPLLSKLDVESKYAFMVEPSAEYNADSQSLNLIISTHSTKNEFNSVNDEIGITLNNVGSDQHYIAKNAYGSTVEVTSHTSSSSSLSLDNPLEYFEWTYRTRQSSFSETINIKVEDNIKTTLVDISPDKAKAYKGNLRFLFISKLHNPFISSGTSYSPATYSSPYSHKYKDYNIHCTAIEIWVYHYKTGNILKKIKIPSTTQGSGSSIVGALPRNIICENELTETFFLSEHYNVYAETCRKSGLNYSHQKIFTFDTKALKEPTSNEVEGFTKTCWGASTNVEKFSIKAAPSTISFIDPRSSVFNIDRETLKAGYDAQRDFTCIISNTYLKNKLSKEK